MSVDTIKEQVENTHRAVKMYAKECLDGKLSRREFMSRATALGASSVAAYGLLGLNAAAADEVAIKQGGTVRIQMNIVGLKDPRTFDWSEMANFARGWLEYLIQFNSDGSLEGRLLESWTANEDVTQYTLNVRKGVTWNNGDPFTAEDVARNFTRWCDATVEGNSMASRVGALIDESTQQAADGAIVVIDDHTVQLNLLKADITIPVGIADYPAAVVHRDHDPDNMVAQALGTGPYIPESLNVGVKGVLVRNENHNWWDEGNGAYLDRIEFIDFTTDFSAHVAGAEADEFDICYQSTSEFIELYSTLDGWLRSDVQTAATIVARGNQEAQIEDGTAPYSDKRVRVAIAKAVDNAIVLDLGFSGNGGVGENHHVCSIHPEYAVLPPLQVDAVAANNLMADAGMLDFEHELISLDNPWITATGDSIAAQMRAAGIKVKRTILPGSTYWASWDKHLFSLTEWNQRPLGIQVLVLAYKSSADWNETKFKNAEFDALLDKALTILDAKERSVVMERLEQIMQEEGVVIQPFWRNLNRFYKKGVVGADMHPTFEIHCYRIGWAA